MSLHDKYFSETNKRHMFSLISDIVLKETGFPIQTDLTVRNLYDTQYPYIFDRVDTDSLVELNRVLLDTVGPSLIQSVLAHEPKQPKQPQQQEQPPSILKKPGSDEPPSDSNPLSPIQEDPEMSLISLISLYSDDRLPSSKNRYHYQISLEESDLGDRDYVNLKRIILPEEPNPLFGMPTIRVKVNDKTIVCSLEDTKCLGDRDYVSYVPEGYASKLQIPVSIDPLTIDILDYKGHVCLPHSDKIQCNHLKSIVYKETPYLCVQVPEATSLHFRKGDTLSLRPSDPSDPSDTDIIKTVIQEIQGSYLLCQDVPVIQKGPWNLLNVSLQNNVSLM